MGRREVFNCDDCGEDFERKELSTIVVEMTIHAPFSSATTVRRVARDYCHECCKKKQPQMAHSIDLIMGKDD